jgi:hypothetical protein
MRTAASGYLAALSQGNGFGVILLVEMDLDSTVYLCSAGFDVVWGGHTYQGAGDVGSIDPVSDSAGEREALRLTLASVPLDYLSLAMGGGYRNKRIRIYEAIYTDAGVVDAPLVWSGSLDQMAISEGAESGQISITAEHRGTTFARAKPLRYTDGDQQLVAPGDRSLQFVVSQANHPDVWPAAAWFKK